MRKSRQMNAVLWEPNSRPAAPPALRTRPRLSLDVSRMQGPEHSPPMLLTEVEALLTEVERLFNLGQLLTSRWRGFQLPPQSIDSNDGPSYSLDGYDHRSPGPEAWEAFDEAEADARQTWENIQLDYQTCLEKMVLLFQTQVPLLFEMARTKGLLGRILGRVDPSEAIHIIHRVVGDVKGMRAYRLQVKGSMVRRYQLPPGRSTVGPLSRRDLTAFVETLPLILGQTQPYAAERPSLWSMFRLLEQEGSLKLGGTLSEQVAALDVKDWTELYAHTLLTILEELIFLWNHLVQPRALLRLDDVLYSMVEQEGLTWSFDSMQAADEDEQPESAQSLRVPTHMRRARTYVYPAPERAAPTRLSLPERGLSLFGSSASESVISEPVCTCKKGRRR